MTLLIVGKFQNIYDEEYIARSFEMIGCTVFRIEQDEGDDLIRKKLLERKPDILLFTKYVMGPHMRDAVRRGRDWGLKTVCWLFDLYIGYEREYRVQTSNFFKADYVFSTDGGHDKEWQKYGVNHFCVRQGIWKEDCWIFKNDDPQGLAFIGSDNPCYLERTVTIHKLKEKYGLKWYGKGSTHEVRARALNVVLARHKIIVGDSVYSPYYWSNRIVETLGRGGFLIHRDVPGLKKEFPDLVTYDGTFEDLCKKIDYYLEHEDERQSIIKKNFKLVKSKYTMEKKCKELLNYIS